MPAMRADRSPRVAVVVLGDLGRSPRMQYHALALAEAGAAVALVGLAGSELPAEIAAHPRIAVHALADPPAPAPGAGRGRYVGGAAVRALRQAAALRRTLRGLGALEAVVVQNPPAIPTLAVAGGAARRAGARLIVDWHNFGYAMLAQRLGSGHPLVRLARRAERALGRRADGHLCVSVALQDVLAAQWGIAARVLYDRPPRRCAPAPAARRDAVVQALCARLGVPGAPRPALIVSPSSWTADEDFDLLLDAVAHVEARARTDAAPLLVLLTGAGALRAHYERRIAARPAGRVHLRTLWLAPADYPTVLAAADLGLCLHRSTSGLDLPMKIADMLGSGLPVCALDYAPCLAEMLHAGETGVLFTTADELADHLCTLFAGGPGGSARLAQLRAGAEAAAAGERWDDAWRAHAAGLILPGR